MVKRGTYPLLFFAVTPSPLRAGPVKLETPVSPTPSVVD
jgi:hypothetical protein